MWEAIIAKSINKKHGLGQEVKDIWIYKVQILKCFPRFYVMEEGISKKDMPSGNLELYTNETWNSLFCNAQNDSPKEAEEVTSSKINSNSFFMYYTFQKYNK